MACDWCEKNKVLEQITQDFGDDLYLCDDCREIRLDGGNYLRRENGSKIQLE